MSILNRLFGVNSTILDVEEATDFSLANMTFVEQNEIAYGLNYQDNGNGSSRVKLLISPLYKSKTYECDTCVNVANEFKGQLSPILIEDSAEVDTVGIIFPTEEINKEGKKYIKSLIFNTYEIKHSTNVPLVEHLGKTKLQKSINGNSTANEGNSYFQPKAVRVGNGNIIVIAHNLKDQALVSWYLESKGDGKFRPLPGTKHIIERKLFKFDNPGQLVLNEKTMLYTQMRKINENQKERTNIFKFDLAKVVQKLKDNEGGECLLKGCQLKIMSSINLNPGKINFLQYVKQAEGNDLVAFLATDQSSNEQKVYLADLVKSKSKSNFTICEFEEPIRQLYVKDNGQDSFITTAISEENIAIFNHKRFEKSCKVMIIPANSVKALSDFVNIINGRLTPRIISSSTVAPITITETSVTSKKVSTTAVTSITRTDALKTTQPTTWLKTQTSTAKSTTVEPTTSTSQATIVSTNASTVPKDITIKPITTTVLPTATNAPTLSSDVTTKSTAPSTPVISSTQISTVKSTAQISQSVTAGKKITTSQVVTLNPEKTTLFTAPSTKAKTSVFTMIPQFTTSPYPIRHAITGSDARVIAGSLAGVVSTIGIIGFIVYKYIKKHRNYYNAAPVLELADLESHSNSSNEEIFFIRGRKNSGGIPMQSETALNSVSVESSSRSSSPSPKSSRSSEPKSGSSLSWDSDDVPEYHL